MTEQECPYHSVTEWPCHASIGNYRCTRPVGHDGDHVACGVDLHVLARTKADPAPLKDRLRIAAEQRPEVAELLREAADALQD